MGVCSDTRGHGRLKDRPRWALTTGLYMAFPAAVPPPQACGMVSGELWCGPPPPHPHQCWLPWRTLRLLANHLPPRKRLWWPSNDPECVCQTHSCCRFCLWSVCPDARGPASGKVLRLVPSCPSRLCRNPRAMPWVVVLNRPRTVTTPCSAPYKPGDLGRSHEL